MAPLDRNLGLFDVFAIATGAMISSGLFLLPGLAAAKTGLSVPLAYLVAGVLMVPAMFAKAELATAMPRAGGSYYFLDRAMGPLVGTIGGLGTWIALVFKSAFALIGMGAYIALFVDVPITYVALVLTVALGVGNALGAKETSGLQRILVTVLLAVVGAFVLLGLHATGGDSVPLYPDQPALPSGPEGFLATVGLVFVSYAGLTKVASVAEEVKDPDHTIPLGMVLSLFVATLVYTASVTVMVLVIPPETLHVDLAPMATAARTLGGEWGGFAVAFICVAAVAAFASTANAGILAASRYPLAMARDRLLPELFAHVGRFGTPLWGVLATTACIAGCILLDVGTVAKLASAFQLLLFAMVNVCVIVMRESNLAWYRPGFQAPLYPVIQVIGILMPLWLIAEMGLLAMAFTVALVLVAAAFYRLYSSKRVERQGAILHLFHRLGKERWEGLDDELRQVLRDKGLRPGDPVEALLSRAPVVKVPGSSFTDVAHAAAALVAERRGLDRDELAEALLDAHRIRVMPVVGAVAFPHQHHEGLDEPELVVVRAVDGVRLDVDGAAEEALTWFFFMLGPAGQSGLRYRMVAHLAGFFESSLDVDPDDTEEMVVDRILNP